MIGRGQQVLTSRQRQSGQVIPLLAVAMVTIIAGAGLVVDAGFAFAETRATQNAADAAARAGALVLAEKMARGSADPKSPSEWDEAVRLAVVSAANANRATITTKLYTDWQGNSLGVSVGNGTSVPVGAAGVRAGTNRTPGTYLVRVIGINSWDINQDATAISGPSSGCTETNTCKTLPITFPINVFQCSGNNKTDPIVPPQSWATDQAIVLPICGGNPGSVGWIDWTPPNGGTSEIVTEVQNPPTVPLPMPVWKYITQTGGISASGLEGAMNAYIGQVVQVPIFDSTCPDQPVNDQVSGCPVPPGGTGTQQWYHLVKLLAFKLDGAFINSNNLATCGLNASQCLTGRFVGFVGEGTVRECVGDCSNETSFAVQLIR